MMLNIYKRKYESEYFDDIKNDFLVKYNPKMVPRVISLIDMDAFFAQVCHVKFNIPRDKPLAVIHNNLVLAVNYPSRAKGVKRGMNKEEVLRLCPDIITPKNIYIDNKSEYLDKLKENIIQKEDNFEISYDNLTEDDSIYKKFSLDMFRTASRMIFELLMGYLPSCKAQIASIDEIYFDLTDLIKKIFDHIKKNMIEFNEDFSKLKNEICMNDINLEIIKESRYDLLSYIKMLFPELFNNLILDEIIYKLYKEDDNNNNNNIYFGLKNLTFEDLCLIIGSVIIYRARQKLLLETTYTCSSGIFKNKIFSKMISSTKKPNGQTVLLSRWLDFYLKSTPILKLRYLGGKLGKQVLEKLPDVKYISDLQKYELIQLIDIFGERNGNYLYNSSYGIDNEPVSNNIERTSIQSSKIFSVPLIKIEEVENWLKLFSNELYHRNEYIFQRNKKKPTRIGVKIKDNYGIIKIRTQEFKYNSDLPSIKEIYESAKNILYNKFSQFNEKHNLSYRKINTNIPKNIRFLIPCKYLGISLTEYKSIITNNTKLEFNMKNNHNKNNHNGNNCDNNYLKNDELLIDAINTEIFGDSSLINNHLNIDLQDNNYNPNFIHTKLSNSNNLSTNETKQTININNSQNSSISKTNDSKLLNDHKNKRKLCRKTSDLDRNYKQTKLFGN